MTAGHNLTNPSPDTSNPRFVLVDMYRGLAIWGVVVFHLVWDLDYLGLIENGLVVHPLWLLFGRSLAGSFMLLVGIALVLAHPAGLRIRSYAKRLLTIVAAATAVTVVTWFAMPDRFVFFGILHAIAAASLIGVVFLKFPVVVTGTVGAAMWVLPYAFSSPFFDTRWAAWIGFSENAPMSNDLVPVFPWVGITLLGMAIFKGVLQMPIVQSVRRYSPDNSAARIMAWSGRRSLVIYLVHQPILLTILTAAA